METRRRITGSPGRPEWAVPMLTFATAILLVVNAGAVTVGDGAGAEEGKGHDSPYVLVLGEERFDPLQGTPDFPDGWDTARAGGTDLHLVQLVGPTRSEWLAALSAQGLEIVQYIHPFTYVVWGSSDHLPPVGELDFVRWTGPFLPAYRVLPKWRALPADEVRVDVLLYRGADVPAAVAQIHPVASVFHGQRTIGERWEIASLTVPGDRLLDVATVPGVYSVQLEPSGGGLRAEMSNQVNVNNIHVDLAFPGYATWLAGVGLSGAGVIMANVDSGVQETHPDLVARLIPCTGVTCSTTSSDHGTHTAGIMAADGSSGVTDSYGFLRAQGMAPGASLVEQVYYPWYQDPGGMLLLIEDSFANGASLSGNSWGPAPNPQGYDNDTMQVDIGVRDADPDEAGNQQFSYILSIMNGAGGTSSQGTPDEAKNIFSIGSTKMQTYLGEQFLDLNNLSANSAHGPCLDGREIPHLVAPGCYVDSSVPPSSYDLKCGTSMASPHVSGTVALFIEYYRNLPDTVEDPSPALVKAAFLPVAHDLAGFLDADGNAMGHPFDSKQGWGRLDAEAVLDPSVAVLYYDDPQMMDNTGEEWSELVAVADGNEPVRVMLVWTDAPGHGLGGSTPAWNNDLDLIVDHGADTFLGNVFGADGWSQTGGSADGMNNTEGVFLQPPISGNLTVRVVAANINSDGVPGTGDTTDQDFAVVVYNALGGTASADLSITKGNSACSLSPGEQTTYTIEVTNRGPGPVTGATVTDLFPPELSVDSWTCVGLGGGSCTASGAGDINDSAVNLPPGASVVYVANATVNPGASGTVVNTATVSSPIADSNPANNSATDADSLGMAFFCDDFESGDTSAWSATVR